MLIITHACICVVIVLHLNPEATSKRAGGTEQAHAQHPMLPMRMHGMKFSPWSSLPRRQQVLWQPWHEMNIKKNLITPTFTWRLKTKVSRINVYRCPQDGNLNYEPSCTDISYVDFHTRPQIISHRSQCTKQSIEPHFSSDFICSCVTHPLRISCDSSLRNSIILVTLWTRTSWTGEQFWKYEVLACNLR